jgi:hypothetical protein
LNSFEKHGSKSAQQNQDQEDDYHKPESSSAIVAGAIEGTAAEIPLKPPSRLLKIYPK